MQKTRSRIHVQLKILAGIHYCTALVWRHGGTGHTFTEYVTLLENIKLDTNTFGKPRHELSFEFFLLNTVLYKRLVTNITNTHT